MKGYATDERSNLSNPSAGTAPPWDTLLPIPRSLVSDRHPQIVGHRGARSAPENTLPAFEIAAALDIDGVEFDVQRTVDGVLVVFHDDEVDRVTTGSGTLWGK